jgi:molybdopterin-guanine dinucleotide biosynthesis protein A
MSLLPYDAIILAGGRARRLGGIDKTALTVGGVSLLERVLSAVADAGARIVVGPSRPTAAPVLWTREDPPGGGPVEALRAALPRVSAAVVAVFAADLPFLDRRVVTELRNALAAASARGRDGVVLVDARGRQQWLTGVWWTDALRRAMATPSTAMHELVRELSVGEIGGDERVCLDCDTETDLAEAAALAERPADVDGGIGEHAG